MFPNAYLNRLKDGELTSAHEVCASASGYLITAYDNPELSGTSEGRDIELEIIDESGEDRFFKPEEVTREQILN